MGKLKDMMGIEEGGRSTTGEGPGGRVGDVLANCGELDGDET